MGFLNGVLLLLLPFGVVFCQLQYIPANILIPTINGSMLVSNYSVYNKSNGSSYINNSTYNRPSYNLGYNYNSSNFSTTYNGSQDGHLILGNIQPVDRLLFRQVCNGN